MTMLPCAFSRPQSDALAGVILEQYAFSVLPSCQYYVRGLHDNYIVHADGQRYMLRIYRMSWRSEADIHFELEWLAHLHTQALPVASAVPTQSGGFTFPVQLAEGKRLAALFYYAEGVSPGQKITPDISALLGETVAKIHQQSARFSCAYKRQFLGVDFLLDDAMQKVIPYFQGADAVWLKQYAKSLKQTLEKQIPNFSVPVVCSGDVNLTNYHITEAGKITLFDFDQCGYGYRVFDIGKYFSSLHQLPNKEALQQAFLNAYQHSVPLNQAELKAIDIYKQIAVIWVMAIRSANAEWIGQAYLQADYWQARLQRLKSMQDDSP